MAIVLGIPVILSATTYGGNGAEVHTHDLMTLLMIQLGIIIFASRVGGALFTRFRLPSVLGEIFAGVCIGPHMLGGVPLLGFHNGLFPLSSSNGIPVSPELYGLATVASIILLFMAGLGTDLKMFLRFSLAGSVIGIGSALIAFSAGAGIAAFFLNLPITAPLPLFLGVVSTATSVDITVRILSENKKLDTPEGATIIAGAVVDDIFSIVLLAMITGYAVLEGVHVSSQWFHVGIIGIRAVFVWIFFTVLGLLFSEKIALFLKKSKSIDTIAILSFGLALILAGVFERAGLAMIIGAYIMGLTLSKTDLSLSIQDKLQSLEHFFDPIFFTTIGMFVNVFSFLSPTILLFGIVFSLGGIIAKLVGCSIPSYFLNFTHLGAARISFGMIPRGEVGLIFAGLGLSTGILTQDTFAVSVMMAVSSTVVGPVVLERLLRKDKKGTRHDIVLVEKVQVRFHCSSSDLADLVERNVIDAYSSEGFYVTRLESDHGTYHFQKEDSLITLYRDGVEMIFETPVDDESYVRNILYETMADLSSLVNTVKKLVRPEEMKKEFAQTAQRVKFNLGHVFRPELIEMDLRSDTKEGILRELVHILTLNGYIVDEAGALKVVWDREHAVSTGMENGVALPHGRFSGVNELTSVIGFHREGVDFNSMDGKPAHVFVLTLVPSEVQAPYVQFLAAIASALNGPQRVATLLEKKTKIEVLDFLKECNDDSREK
ncbi:cation:proton antiporter [Chitinivibrio alkaliphilus]|uniref:cation:proton antiporter domain-containing protein n=1 Tax=Chitinivibrio alkaliphilus TaxID=1505232 RepID=UPI00138AB3D5|nr:cation:proton antiporter [Chitinivibrio alkaliphilus]